MKKRYVQPSLAADRWRLGVRLFDLALKFSREVSTQAVREDAIRVLKTRRRKLDGKSGIRYLREQVDLVTEEVKASRAARARARTRAGEAAQKARQLGVSFGRPVRLPQGTLEERLQARVETEVLDYYRYCYRYDEAGSLGVRLTRDPAQVGVYQAYRNDWDYYPKQVRYPKQVVTSVITVPAAWWPRVRDRNLENVDNLLTLDAQLAEGAPAGVELYSATWLEQGRGYSVTPRRGYLALDRKTGTSYHGESAEKAVKGLARKLGLTATEVALQDLLTKHDIAELVAQHPDCTVTLADARRTGACEFGIKSWCQRCNLPYEAGKASLARVYECYQQHPLPEARAAILQAIRRQRSVMLAA